ncbi:MAG: hypothetical protein EOO10_08450 [Chitinophagaceae bacterium]|nr:MAG: hypothetical protein EOO10_08450 [Chitinophagaceae bacterium]
MKKKEKKCIVNVDCRTGVSIKCRQCNEKTADKQPDGSAEVKALYQAEAQTYFFYFASPAHTA